MNTIIEADLLDNSRNLAIKRIQIVQGKNLKYQLIVNLTWKEGDLVVITRRKKPREWVNLHRLALHMIENYGTTPEITLTFYQPKEIKPDDGHANEKP